MKTYVSDFLHFQTTHVTNILTLTLVTKARASATSTSSITDGSAVMISLYTIKTEKERNECLTALIG